MNEENTAIEKVNSWIKNSVTLKLITITFLVLLLLIPTEMITSIIQEREELNNQAINEVSSKWANKQVINGPILTIPLNYEQNKGEDIKEWTKFLQVLPEKLSVNGKIDPEKLRRGIYEIVVYKSNISVSGSFIFNQKVDQTNLKEILWSEAFLTIGISDLRGIEDELFVKWNDQDLKVQPGSKITDIIYSGITINLPNIENLQDKNVPFQFDLKLQGSQNLSFIPVGSETNIEVNSSWPSPSFNGTFLPDHRDVRKDGFSAHWKVLQLNRNFPQTWIGLSNGEKLNQSAFGVDLILPLDDYQKSMRSAKYAIMTVTLTFLIFFLVEIINGIKIHPFQYTLVGLSLCLFYALLVSISEHSNFNLAYLISTVAIVTMITFYSYSVFKVKKFTMLLFATLIAIYGFLFITLQLADYALLMGSIGLALIMAATMYYTRNINWYSLNLQSD